MFWQFIKVAHMIGWRLLLLALILNYRPIETYDKIMIDFVLFVCPFLISALIVFVLKRTIGIFPLIRIITFNSPFLRIQADPYRRRKNPRRDRKKSSENKDVIYHASRKGIMSGFEPSIIDDVKINRYNRYMHGTPGSGLNSSGFSEKNIEAGQKGEINFAKALHIVDTNGNIINDRDTSNSLINKVHTFWSMSIPSLYSNKKNVSVDSEADVDMIFAFKRSLILVDLKFYKGGDVIYQEDNYGRLCIIDSATQNIIGKPRKMSLNMKNATRRYKKLFPDLKVSSYVVLVPTNSGIGTIKNVKWPGEIPLIHLQKMLSIVAKTHHGEASEKTLKTLKKLIK